MNIRQTAIPRRVLSLALCAAMVLTLLPLPTPAEGICGHHPEHTADCGYKAAVEGQDCAHSHDSLCGYQEASPCSHSHDSLCGYREASACAHRHTEECGENGESCTHQHDEACGYQEASPCTHSHDESCGYREARDCTHAHDDTCGYVEAVTGSPCTYRCEICAQQASQQQNGQDLCTHGNESAACETCASEKKVAEVQALINALPETVTEKTREEAQSALSAVEEAKATLTEAEQEKLDLTRYTALKALLAEPEAFDTGKVLTDWEWVDPDEWLDETGSFAMPGVTEDYPAYFEDVVEYLPTQITALIDGVEVTLDLGVWECDDYPVETGTSQGEFVFTATLPEGYVLADGSNTLPLPVTVAPMDLSDGEDVSGYDYKGSGLNESWDDVSFNGVRNWNKETSEFDFASSNTTMYYRKITKQYTGDVEWTKYDHLKITSENQDGYYIYNVGYCVYSKTAEITGTLTINADIHLVLWAGGTGNDSSDMVLTVGNIQIPEGKTLTIWTRNAGYQGGKLIVKGDISGGGTLVVRDGYVEAQNITCKFSTGGSENGKQSLGVVKANSITDKTDQANWGGVIVENGAGRAYGTAAQELIYDLQCDTLTIDSGKTLTVGWDGYNNIGARHNVKLIANNLVNNGTLINKAKLYYNTLSGSGRTDPSNGGYGYYKNENGQKVYRPFTLVTSDITELTNTADTNDGWYLVSGNVEWANRVAVAATKTVNLVLADGCTLTAKEGITVGGAGNPTLIIWCQEAGTGTLNAQTSNKECAAIGMNEGDNTGNGKITIHGGNINAKYTGSGSIDSKNCGLGGHYIRASCTVTINGGTITTPALVADNLTINGGTITVSNLISGGFLAPATDGGSTFVTAGENWAGGTSNRRGLFFFGDTGEVCTGSGTELTLARAMEVPTGMTLEIPQGKTLNAGSYLTNKGAVCVGGAYTGSLGGSGEVYYRLSVTGGTAASATDTKTIGGVTYVKAGSTVTLTPDAAPTGKRFDHWNLPAGLTLTDNTFPMPANTVDISAAYSDAVVITQSPEDKEITYGEIATLSVTAQNPSNTTDGITYQWYQVINNKEEKLPGGTNASLELTTLNAGTYVYFCRVTWEGISIDSSKATVKVNQATGSVTFTNTSLDKTYNGQSVVLTKDTDYTVTGDGAVTVEYTKQGETNYSTTAPTNAGKYTVRVTLAAGTNYTGDSESKDFTISKAYNTWTKKPSVKTPAYYGDTDLVTYEARYGNESVSVNYVDKNDNTVAPVNAGEYKVIVSLPESSVNYTGIGMVVMDLTILPRSITDEDVTVTLGSDFVYDAGVKTQTVTIQYKGKTLVEGKDYELTGATSGTAADAYTLTITGRGNFSETTTKTWNITKASITPVVSLGDTVYGDPLSPSVSGNPGNGVVTYSYYSDAACTVEATPNKVGTYYVKAAVAQTTNYQSGESAPVPFRITQKPVIVSGITAGDKTYDGNTTATLNYAGVTFTGKLEGDSLTVTAIGTFESANAAKNKTVNIRDLGLGGASKNNYVLAADGQQTAATATITKANASVTKAPEDAKSLYSGGDIPLVIAGDVQGGTMHYSLDGETWSAKIPTATEWGKYTVYFKVVGDNNHNGTEAQPLTAEIVPFEIKTQPKTESVNYGESKTLAVILNLKAADVSGITYQWCLVTVEDGKEIFTPLEGETSSELTLTKPNAGNYVYACVVTCGDYSETSGKATVTVTPGEIPVAPGTDIDLGDFWLEGGEAPASENQTKIPERSPSSRLLTQYSTKENEQGDLYPSGMAVYRVVEGNDSTTVEKIDALDNLLRYSGCSIRINGKPGIRMITSLTKEAKELLKKGELAGYTLEEYGTVAVWSSDLDNQPLTLNTKKSRSNYAYKRGVSDPVFANVGALTQYTNVLVWDSLEAKKYDEDIVMRPYIKLSNKAGETVVLYGGTVSRSIGYVAQQNANTFSKGTAGYKYVHEIIDKVNALNSSTGTNTTTGGNG